MCVFWWMHNLYQIVRSRTHIPPNSQQLNEMRIKWNRNTEARMRIYFDREIIFRFGSNVLNCKRMRMLRANILTFAVGLELRTPSEIDSVCCSFSFTHYLAFYANENAIFACYGKFMGLFGFLCFVFREASHALERMKIQPWPATFNIALSHSVT